MDLWYVDCRKILCLFVLILEKFSKVYFILFLKTYSLMTNLNMCSFVFFFVFNVNVVGVINGYHFTLGMYVYSFVWALSGCQQRNFYNRTIPALHLSGSIQVMFKCVKHLSTSGPSIKAKFGITLKFYTVSTNMFKQPLKITFELISIQTYKF